MADGPAKGYRSRTRITLDLMGCLREPCNVAGLLRGANLSHPRLKEYLADLQRQGWAEPCVGGWRLTQKGHAMRAELERVARQMADYGLPL